MDQHQTGLRIETDRIILRPLQIDDAATIASLIDYEAARMTAGMPYPCTLETAQAFVVRMQASRDDQPFMIERRGEGVVGMTGFYSADRPFLEFGFWLGGASRGQGLAAEAAGASMAWARDAWGKRVVASGHFIDNRASAQVLDKVGFLYTGVVEAQYSHGRDALVDTRLMIWLA